VALAAFRVAWVSRAILPFATKLRSLAFRVVVGVIVADFHLGGLMAERLERGFHPVITENLADTEGILRQHSDDLLQWDNFDVLLDARVLPARKMTLI
jgi:hypothetical protein